MKNVRSFVFIRDSWAPGILQALQRIQRKRSTGAALAKDETLTLRNPGSRAARFFFPFSILFYFWPLFFDRIFDQFYFFGPDFWPEIRASFFVKRSKNQKNVKKKFVLIVKRSNKSKICQKSAFLIVKRSKKQQIVKKVPF